jgi:SAM-dependent MidA family methyltransferase
MWVTWREAMRGALYGPGGFYVRGEAPGRHYRTSSHAGAAYAGAVLALLAEVDAALGRPAVLDLVDVGAGDGELLAGVLAAASARPRLRRRIRAQAVDLAPAPTARPPGTCWRRSLPRRITGLVVASEWLDNIPLDVVTVTPAGPRLVLVDPATGDERAGPPPRQEDLAWLAGWWPAGEVGGRAEIGRPRCRAWARVIARIEGGAAVAMDYCHLARERPAHGTLTGYLRGRAVAAVPDGSRDVTAHVALDACADSGRRAGATASLLTSQRRALSALGLTGRRPPPERARCDPAGYLHALSRASLEAELLDPRGLGGFGWLIQTVGIPVPGPLAAAAPLAA